MPLTAFSEAISNRPLASVAVGSAATFLFDVFPLLITFLVIPDGALASVAFSSVAPLSLAVLSSIAFSEKGSSDREVLLFLVDTL